MKFLATVCLAAVAVLTPGWAPAANDKAHDLTIAVSGAEATTGQAVIAVFRSPETFLKEPLVSQTVPIDGAGRAVIHLNTLSSGTYAISAYYDRDSNGKLNTGLFGIPTELVAFSNGAKGLFGPPEFRKAAFSLTGARTIKIRFGKAKP